MLNANMIDVVNSKEAWAFIGSGVSIDSGGPTWKGLVDNCIDQLEVGLRRKIRSDVRFKDGLETQDYPKSFGRIENIAGRNALESAVRTSTQDFDSPGDLLKELVDWPFRGYITTNYDPYIERALELNGEDGWAAVGNTNSEMAKVTGDTRSIVWHIHGGIEIDSDSSKLVLTNKDYDDLYLEDNQVLQTLQGLLAHRRVLFFGFGFNDPAVDRLLRRVGRMSSPLRPSYVFLGSSDNPRKQSIIKEIDDRSNLDILPYRIEGDSHRQLVTSVDVHGSMVLKRSLHFGSPKRPCPSYDPETTSLYVYNTLVANPEISVEDDVLDALLRARILSILNDMDHISTTELTEKVNGAITILAGTFGCEGVSKSADVISGAIKNLMNDDYVEIETNNEELLCLTDKGKHEVLRCASRAKLLEEQFSNSLFNRAQKLSIDDDLAAKQIGHVAESFLKDAIKRRGLGVSMVLCAPQEDFRRFHILALLKLFPKYLHQLANDDEAKRAINLIRAVLSSPNEIETRYIGATLQAHFGIALLGLDPNALTSRIMKIQNTAFVLDASTLIPYIAEYSKGHLASSSLVNKLLQLGATLLTTDYLIDEVVEHADYAASKIRAGKGAISSPVLTNLKGEKGESPNVFLDGHVTAIHEGKAASDFQSYMHLCGLVLWRGSLRAVDLKKTLQGRTIEVITPSEVITDCENLQVELEELAAQIKTVRESARTFRHERQVRAEAEVRLLVERIRVQKFAKGGLEADDAYFVSSTGAIDRINRPGLHVTMRETALLQLLGTLTKCGDEELKVLTDGLVSELESSPYPIVDDNKIRSVFGVLTDLSKDSLYEIAEQHRGIMAAILGGEPSEVIRDVDLDPLDYIALNERISAQVMDALHEQLIAQTKRAMAAEDVATLTEREKTRLARLERNRTRSANRRKTKKRAIKSNNRRSVSKR